MVSKIAFYRLMKPPMEASRCPYRGYKEGWFVNLQIKNEGGQGGKPCLFSYVEVSCYA